MYNFTHLNTKVIIVCVDFLSSLLYIVFQKWTLFFSIVYCDDKKLVVLQHVLQKPSQLH